MSQTVRPAVYAGQWYPGDPGELRRVIDRFFAGVEPLKLDGEIVGLISPHAGWAYSGQTAAYAYRQVRGQSFDLVVVISPVHRMYVGAYTATVADVYRTPLGDIALDLALLDALEARLPLTRLTRDNEHSLEIQLPFLQAALGDFNLLPLMIGGASFDAGAKLGLVLADLLAERRPDQRTLIVASSDLHHIADYSQVVRRDRVVIDAIAGLDLARIKDVLSSPDCSVCGRIPIYALLTAALAMGATGVETLHYTNSGDVSGMREPGQYTVGYMAAAVYKE